MCKKNINCINYIMSNLLFDAYAVKSNLKFYKTEDNDERITASIDITANHHIEDTIYQDLSAFIEKLLIEDYINEQSYQSKKAHEKALMQEEKSRRSKKSYLLDRRKLRVQSL